jgi:hypothetical protein
VARREPTGAEAMPITAEDCRREGLSESTIESMERNGFFHETDPTEDRRDDLTGEIEEATEEITGWESEVAELLESISQARVKLARRPRRPTTS